jgi:hypothetical protein
MSERGNGARVAVLAAPGSALDHARERPTVREESPLAGVDSTGRGQMPHLPKRKTRTETIFYDAHGKVTTDKSLAVRVRAIEVDEASGKVIECVREVYDPRGLFRGSVA